MRLLLDVHISPQVAADLRKAGIDAASAVAYRGGALREADDAILLQAAADDLRILVTYDLRTIPAILAEMALRG